MEFANDYEGSMPCSASTTFRPLKFEKRLLKNEEDEEIEDTGDAL